MHCSIRPGDKSATHWSANPRYGGVRAANFVLNGSSTGELHVSFWAASCSGANEPERLAGTPDGGTRLMRWCSHHDSIEPE